MARFEEVQMKIAESAKNYLEVYNMQVFIEQFTLDRESRFSLTLPEMEPPFPVSAIASFTYDAFQTGMSLYKEDKEDNIYEENTMELEFTVRLPIMQGYPDIETLLEEIEKQYPDTEPILTVKETFAVDEPAKEYEIFYAYDIAAEDMLDSELYDEIFEELREIMEIVYNRTKYYIDVSWYRGEDDPSKGY
jgi:hypothetical protein